MIKNLNVRSSRVYLFLEYIPNTDQQYLLEAHSFTLHALQRGQSSLDTM